MSDNLPARSRIDATSADAIFNESMRRNYVATDRMFAVLMGLQWLVGIVLALTISPSTWIGDASQTHVHVWAAVFLGGALSALPMILAWKLPGEIITRQVVAVAQMLWSALLIHLTGGRIETHFHVFGSLAFLSFYRDWRVLLTATIVVATDHFIRGIWWPQSAFGVLVESPYRWIEHAVWVVFEDVILVWSCVRGTREAREIAIREAGLEVMNEDLAAQNRERRRAEDEIRRLYDDLALAHDAVVEASRTKSQFLANMSHELRTPLNAIIGYSELMQLLAAKKKDETFTPDLQKIHKAGTHLLNLINDVLDISKIEAGKMQLELEVFDVSDMIRDLVDTAAPLAATNGNEFRLVVSEGLRPISADAVRLKQCLLNLLSNACKFTKKGTVDFAVYNESCPTGDRLVFQVRDTGIGLSDEQAAKLFQPFTQADATTTRKFGGTGLGLAITKKLCEAMGGEILLRSRLGEGSTFSISLPVDGERRNQPISKAELLV